MATAWSRVTAITVGTLSTWSESTMAYSAATQEWQYFGQTIIIPGPAVVDWNAVPR